MRSQTIILTRQFLVVTLWHPRGILAASLYHNAHNSFSWYTYSLYRKRRWWAVAFDTAKSAPIQSLFHAIAYDIQANSRPIKDHCTVARKLQMYFSPSFFLLTGPSINSRRLSTMGLQPAWTNFFRCFLSLTQSAARRISLPLCCRSSLTFLIHLWLCRPRLLVYSICCQCFCR